MALKPVDPTDTPRRRRTISLRLLMIVGFGGLVALSVGGVLAMSVYANFSNTLTLLNRQAIQLIDGMEQTIIRDASEGERVVEGLARLYQNREFELEDREALSQILSTLLLSENVVETITVGKVGEPPFGMGRNPQNKIITLEGPGGNGNRPQRGAGQKPPGPHGEAPPPNAPSRDNDRANGPSDKPPERQGTESKAKSNPEAPPTGDAPVWREPEMVGNVLFHKVHHALKRDGQVEGIAIAAVGGHSLNRVVTAIGKDHGTTAFVTNGLGEVIAHSHQPHHFQQQAQIPAHTFPDSAVKAFAQGLNDVGEENDEGVKIGSATDEDGNEYIFISKDISAMSDTPYALTAYFDAAELSSELERIVMSVIIGLIAFVLAVALAIFFGNRLSNPLRKIANSASQFARLELEDYRPLPRSSVREIDDQTNAMNAMHTALSEFGHYVPKELVRRLLHSGTEATRSVEREITVMFTDVAGFTAMSEHLSASDVVTFLNSHFDLVCTEIKNNGGTVDKFMGDGLMAFWGAPEADNDHAKHALAAVPAIAEAFRKSNEERAANGLTPLRLRMGIHTGRAVIGNIGGAGRHNYTVVGDVVNVASRLEQLGKDLMDGQDVIACVSADCRVAAGSPTDLTSAGMHTLRGRAEPIEVFVAATKDSDIVASASVETSLRDVSA